MHQNHDSCWVRGLGAAKSCQNRFSRAEKCIENGFQHPESSHKPLQASPNVKVSWRLQNNPKIIFYGLKNVLSSVSILRKPAGLLCFFETFSTIWGWLYTKTTTPVGLEVWGLQNPAKIAFHVPKIALRAFSVPGEQPQASSILTKCKKVC